MKSLFKAALFPLILSTPALEAATAVPGWYAGMVLGGTMTPAVNNPPLQSTLRYNGPGANTINYTLNHLTPDALASIGLGDYNQGAGSSNVWVEKLKYGFNGNIGAQVGYRFLDRYRIEGQFLLTQSSYQSIDYSYINTNNTRVHRTLRGKKSDQLGMQGATTSGLVFVNGFIDMMDDDPEKSLYPYLGAGIGYAYIKNHIKFFNAEGGAITNDFKQTQSTPAIQGILGLSYLMDTFTSIGLDYRYLTTRKIDALNASLRVHSINVVFNGMFNCA